MVFRVAIGRVVRLARHNQAPATQSRRGPHGTAESMSARSSECLGASSADNEASRSHRRDCS